jgi:hypothetical protein
VAPCTWPGRYAVGLDVPVDVQGVLYLLLRVIHICLLLLLVLLVLLCSFASYCCC